MKNIAIAYGSGGHKSQAHRLENYLLKNDFISKGSCFYIIESDVVREESTSAPLYISPVRHKYSKIKTLFMMLKIPFNILRIINFIKRNDISLVISPGPGCAITTSIACKLIGKKFIFIESWSRFTSLSLSGKLCSRLTDEFWVQNKSLLKTKPDATFVGRL